MSRVGQSPILLSENIDVSKEGNLIKAKGPLGELKLEVIDSINLEIDNKLIKVTNSDKTCRCQALAGCVVCRVSARVAVLEADSFNISKRS